jgi:hypothetical protein
MRTLFVPAFDQSEANTVAESIARGETGLLAHYTDRDEVDRICAHLNRNRLGERYRTFAVQVRERFVDDGRIYVAWPTDQIGEIAATLALVVGGCWLVGWSTLL